MHTDQAQAIWDSGIRRIRQNAFCAIRVDRRTMPREGDHSRRCAGFFTVRPETALSLLYNKLEPAVQRELAASIVVPFSQITFDRIKAVRCVSPTQSRADVESWRVIT